MYDILGVPTDIDTANTYYSQHDDFEDDEEEIEEDLKDGEGEDDDLQDLIGMMQEAIDTTLDKSLTVHDDTVAGAFGPAARNVKIRNLRAECETKLGKEAFDHAYKYLRESRFSDNSTTIDETLIMKKLRKVVPNPSDCFLVDQLLFLEEQAKIAHM
ncbi:unnamed protein product [Owenia fusiformis]|uniref:Uncharacterized protein n=1 Tax=Owenia fusiformis TaxID=6347 RepID=A0A8S4NG57_OWEFU|nr:unnamed protein product [Owenia fusiformis]